MSVDGVDAVDAAWLIAQHADLHNERRAAFLPLMEELVQAGEVDPRQVACLSDRIAIGAERAQKYGTSVTVEIGPSSSAALRVTPAWPVDDIQAMESRRAALGLPSWEEEAPGCALAT